MRNLVSRLLLGLLLVFQGYAPESLADDSARRKGNGPRDNEAWTAQITDFRITWKFKRPVRYGQFANGHYWVLAPVTITRISPDYDGAHHGWEVNPSDTANQGFDSRVPAFDGSRVPSLPYEASAGESLVKAVSVNLLDDRCRPCIQRASVLTVVDEVPPDDGRTVFRPPYFGTVKPFYSTRRLRIELLPQLPRIRNAPTFRQISRRYMMVQLDHKVGWTGRYLHPREAMPDYGADIASRNAESALALMLKGSAEDKWGALVRYVNNGIDIYHMMLGGVTWPPNGGHGEGRKLPAVFAALLLNDAQMMDDLRTSGRQVFGENGGIRYSESARTVIFAQVKASEEAYWKNLVFDTGSRTIMDPYGYIDGGHRPGGSYQFCCLSKNWKATVTALRLMPELIPVFNSEDLFTYVDRWVTFGSWTQPDPCAPPDGVCLGGTNAGTACTSANEADVCSGKDARCDLRANWATNYGATYGPDGKGGCIVDTDPSDGTGRFPQLHGINADEGYHGSGFADEMWAAYVTD